MSGAVIESDGHFLLDGARWHYPKPGSPTECSVAGCDRTLSVKPVNVLGDDVDFDDPDPEDGPEPGSTDA